MALKNRKDFITIGFALFAMFFGAGNLLLPPYIGLLVGDQYFITILAFALSGILLPLMGIVAVTMSGDSIEDMGKWTNRGVITVLGTLIMLSIGPLIAIPRTAATTFEVGIQPIFPEAKPIATSVVFFIITLFLSISSSKVVDIIGKFLTPVLLVVLTILVVLGVFFPISSPQSLSVSSSKAFSLGFVEGYQTLDALASLIFSGIIIAAAKAKGHTLLKEKTRIVILSGILSAACLVFIYGGLVYLGTTSGIDDPSIRRSDLLIQLAQNILGGYSTYAIAVCIGFACLTTAVALTSAFGSFFERLTNGKVNYKIFVVVCCIFSGIISILGVDDIITYAYPFLAFVYPIAITLVVYIVVFGRRIKIRSPYIGALIATTLFSLIEVSIKIFNYSPKAFLFIQDIPLYAYEVGWLIPSAIGFMAGFAFKDKNEEEVLMEESPSEI